MPNKTNNTLDKAEIERLIKVGFDPLMKVLGEPKEYPKLVSLLSLAISKRLEKTIADREKEMLEFVINIPEPTIREYYGDRVNVDMQVQEMYRSEMSGRRTLKSEQRQRAKKWEGRK